MISVITCSIDPLKFSAVSCMWSAVFGTQAWEMIGIHDARSLAEGYNRGLKSAKGDVIVFAHDDLEILSKRFAQRVRGHLSRFDVIGVAGASRLVSPLWINAGLPYIFGQVAHRFLPDKIDEPVKYVVDVYNVPTRAVGNIKLLDGVLLAGRREIFERIPFDSETFNGFHLYDLDFSIRAFQAGYRLGVACDLHLVHFSLGTTNPDWRTYALQFVEKHRAQFEINYNPFQRAWGSVGVLSREQVIVRMTPEYWEPDPESM